MYYISSWISDLKVDSCPNNVNSVHFFYFLCKILLRIRVFLFVYFLYVGILILKIVLPHALK